MQPEHATFESATMPDEEPSSDLRRVLWPNETLKLFRLIFKAVQQHSQRVEANCGVSSAQLWIMWELSKCPGLRVTELAKTMSIHQSTASNLVEKLVKKGLLARERNSQDLRVVSLSLTEPGRVTLREAPAPLRGILQHALFNLPGETLRSLAANLDALVAEMGIHDEQAAMQPIAALRKARKTKGGPR